MVYYELKKIFSRTGSRIALLALVLVLGIVAWSVISETEFINEEGRTETGLDAIRRLRDAKKEWAGELTEEKIRQVIAENVRISHLPDFNSVDPERQNRIIAQLQGIQDIRFLLVYDYSGFNIYDYTVMTNLSPEAASDFYPNRVNNLREWLDTEGKAQFSEKEKEWLISRYEALETPIYYDYQEGWQKLFQYAPTVTMLTTLILGFLCAGIFSGEFQLKASAVFYSSCHGRGKAVAAKVKAGLCTVTVIYWGMMLLYTGIVLGLLGTDGANCQIQSYRRNWESIYNITNLQEYLLIIGGGYLGCLFMLLLTMVVSAKTKSAVLAVIVPFALIFLPGFLSGNGNEALRRILGLLPDQLLQLNLAVRSLNIYEVCGKVIPAVPALGVVYFALSAALAPLLYHIYRKKQVY